MGFVPVMWTLWGVAFLFMAVASIYSARLGKNEEDQVFLSDSSSREDQSRTQLRIGWRSFSP